MVRINTAAAALLAIVLAPGLAIAQGVETRRSAVVLYGSCSNTTKPATIDMAAVEDETPEHKTIKAEGVKKGSARYEILIAKMQQRIKTACKTAAEAAGNDCVVRDGDIKDARGLEIADLTQAVIDELETSGDPT